MIPACALAAVLALPPGAAAFTVELETGTVRPGDTLVVSVSPVPAGEIPLTCRFKGKDIPVYALDGSTGNARALIGIPTPTKPGRYPLRVGHWKGWVRVEKHRPPVQRLSIRGKRRRRLLRDMHPAGEATFLRERLGTESSRRYWSGIFRRPVEGSVSTAFGTRRVFNRGARVEWHRGVDLRSPQGTPVAAAQAGVVILAGRYGPLGNMICLNHGHGVVTLYGHLHRIDVTEGMEVNAGRIIGAVGSTGLSTAPHLHWGLYVHGVQVNPTPWTEREF